MPSGTINSGGTLRLPRPFEGFRRQDFRGSEQFATLGHPAPVTVAATTARAPAAATAATPETPPQGQRATTRSDLAVGGEIRRLRRGQGKTLKVLAETIGVTGAQLHRYETGATRIAASRLISIADALGVRADILISAGSTREAAPLAETDGGDDDIVELIRIFGTISDPRHRGALVSVARMMAAHYQRHDRSDGQD